jgi:hypothetical protein
LGIKGGTSFSEESTFCGGNLSHKGGERRLCDFKGGFMLDLKILPKWYFHSEIILEDKG